MSYYDLVATNIKELKGQYSIGALVIYTRKS